MMEQSERERTHHKHSSTKGYRRCSTGSPPTPLCTGSPPERHPRMGAGRPMALISKVRPVASGLSITINVAGAIVDAYVITDQPGRGRRVHGRAGLDAS